MEKIKKTDTMSPGSIELDPAQLEELDRLIDNLKKEIIFPERKKDRQPAVLKTAGS